MNMSSFPRCVPNTSSDERPECNFEQMSGIPFCWFWWGGLQQTLLTGKGKSQGLLTLPACFPAFPQGGMQNTPSPTAPGSLHHQEAAVLCQRGLCWSPGRAAANRAAGQPSSISLSVLRLREQHPHHSSSLPAMTWTPALQAVISEA